MVRAFAQNQIGARTCRQNVFTQIFQIDVLPQAFGDCARAVCRHARIAVEKRFRVLKRRVAQTHETVDIPTVDQAFIGINIDREIKEVRNERHRASTCRQWVYLQNIDAFKDQYVRAIAMRLAKVQEQRNKIAEPELVWWIISALHQNIVDEFEGRDVTEEELEPMLDLYIDQQAKKAGW